jgi:hypothetical protein
LCIIQDDPDDWAREAVFMSKVYGNSHLNIAATDARDGGGGCFPQERPSLERFWRLQIQLNVAGTLVTIKCVPRLLYQYCVSCTPLSRRAWTLQERLLAPRTLYCSAGQLFWGCNKGHGCESFPEEAPAGLMLDDTAIDKRDLSKDWSRIVYTFSVCHLTEKSDKLVAMAGIIRRIQGQTSEECLTGLWRNSMETEILWKSMNPESRPQTYRAPSWSWAAVDGDVEIFGRSRSLPNLQAHVLDAYVSPT